MNFSSAFKTYKIGLVSRISCIFLLGLALFCPVAFAAEPLPWQLGFQEGVTPVTRELDSFHNLLLIIITGIVVFVLALLLYVMFRFNAKSNPEPSTTTHNVAIEVIWTVVPVIILTIIAIPSFKILYFMDRVVDPDMTLEVVGYQWGWTFKYPDHGEIEFNSDMISDEDMGEYFPQGNGRRLLETYNPVVLPLNKNIEFLITARDVLHSFAMPSFGFKTDAVPGRYNHAWARVEKPGVYFGQCSEICGERHAFMPVSIYVVKDDEFNAWVDCVQNDEADSFYPSRACVQKLNFDKYRKPLKDINRLDFAMARDVKDVKAPETDN